MEILHSIYILNSKYSSYRVLIFFWVPLEHVIHAHTPSVCSVEMLWNVRKIFCTSQSHKVLQAMAFVITSEAL